MPNNKDITKAPTGRPAKSRLKVDYNTFVRIINLYLRECEDKKQVPLLQKVGLLLGLSMQAISEYRQKPMYGDVIKRIDTIQEEALLNKGLNENKPVFSMFLLKAKHGYIESQYQKVDLNVSGGLAVIRMPDKKPKIVSG